MKTNPISLVGILILTFFCNLLQAQNFGASVSAVYISNCNADDFYNTTGSNWPTGFNGLNLGTYTQNYNSLILRGAHLRTFKNPGANVCASPKMYYRVYLASSAPGPFSSMDLTLLESCDVPSGNYPSGGACVDGDQKWELVVPDGSTSPSPVDLTTFPPGAYKLEVYYEISGSNSSTTLCNESVLVNNGGNNFIADFFIQSPTVSSTNPSSCFGSQGSITIGGLNPFTSYDFSYTDDGTPVGPLTIVTNSSGQLIVTGLDKGFYSNFTVDINGCSTPLFTGVILSDPIFVPTFPAIPPFCQGTTAPILPTTSTNGLSGTWSPATVSNTATGTYTFTPGGGQCANPITRTITVIPRTTPTFAFGTSLIICGSGTVPTLPNNSTNGISGTWSPATVSNTTSGVYTFTPNAGQCANGTTFSVTVNPNITPTFALGTSLSICSGDAPPSLPTTSQNGITGTWSPSTINNTTSGTYTFTPGAGQCAVPTSLSVTVNPIQTPVFSFGNSTSICNGSTAPILPPTSTNGVTGVWVPATVDNQNSGTYIFQPASGQCAVPVNFSVTVTPKITPSFSWGGGFTICAGAAIPTLVTTSLNGITGSWNPTVVDNNNSGSYTFTPDPGQCANPFTFAVTVNPNITPSFSFGTALSICNGDAPPSLPTTSQNGISGTWSPSTINNTTSGTYTFTPGAGQCAVPTSLNVTVNPIQTPVFSFGTSTTICNGSTAPTLPPTSTNGVTGVWVPATVDNQNSGTYIFQPASGQCAVPVNFSVSVTPKITPSFSWGGGFTICAGGSVPALVNTSLNGITGTWSPTVVDNNNSGSYTFTPDPGQCANPFTFAVTVNPNVTPAFAFGTSISICNGATAPVLPTNSTNGIAGTWSPSTINNTTSGTYTFTPNPGLCAVPISLSVTVDPIIVPVFSFGTTLTICAGGTVPSLPGSSTNGINGTWSPAIVDNQNSGTYTFTPAGGQCSVPTSFNVTVNPNITPTFTFGTTLTICANGTVPTLPNSSTNGITGTWSPATVDNTTSGSYTFTPDAGLCAVNATFTVTVIQNVTPTFSFGGSVTICSGATAPVLPTTSSNGIAGTWSPATVNNTTSGTYTFTPNPGQCVIPPTVSLSVTITPNTIPTFSFGNSLSICAGGTVPSLPTTSDNGVTGTWNPATVNSQSSGTYIFTPTAGVCALPFNYTVTVSPIVVPRFAIGTLMSVCVGTVPPVLLPTSTNGIPGTWSPSVIDPATTATYTFTPSAGQCASPTAFIYEVNSIPSVGGHADIVVKSGDIVPAFNFTSSPGSVVRWTNNNATIGLAASGTGTVPSFTAINENTFPVFGTVTLTPTNNGCIGTLQTYKITVMPLSRDLYVPNVFSPNNDGKNDIFYVYGNYISKIELQIYNQWGQHITTITDKNQGWDGKFKGNPQPVGVYVYVLKVEMQDKREINMKGSITLVR